MDGNLFIKHIHNLTKKKTEKNILIKYIHEYTGILLEENEITINNKQVIFTISSVIQSKLLQKNIKTILKEKGYNLK